MPILDNPDFGHALVPIDSLTNSPRSSTGSASVLEWNSNSGSEGFSVSCLEDHHCSMTPTTPFPPSYSPNRSTLKEPASGGPSHDQIFTSGTSAAPINDSASHTLTADTFVDEYRNLIGALGERLTLQDSVTQWQNHSYRETAGLDRPETPLVIELPDDAYHDKQHNNAAPSPNRSVVTDSSISAVTARPSLHVSSLFLPPPRVDSVPPSVISDNSHSKSISIGQYFQLKAAKTEGDETVQPPVNGPPRPISASSYLSYASGAESPAPTPAHVEHNETWQDFVSNFCKDSSSCPPPTMFPLRSQCSYPETPSYGERIARGPSWGCYLDAHTSSHRKPQMEHDNTGPQSNPFTTKSTPPLSQATNTLESNSKNHGPSKATWPIPPGGPCQPEFVTPSFKPIKPIVPNIESRQLPYLTSPYDSFYGNIPRLANRPVSYPSLQNPGTAYPTYNCQIPPPPVVPHQTPWLGTRDIGQVSPESSNSGFLPPTALPSSPSASVRWPSPTPSGSLISVSGAPPSPPPVDLELAYLRHAVANRESNGPSSTSNTSGNRPQEDSRNTPFPPPAPSRGPGSLGGAYQPTERVRRALPIPSIPKPLGMNTQAPYTPRYTGSTLPRDMHLSAGPPTWGPTPRRLRFAPLPPTPSAGLSSALPYVPYTTPLPPYPLYPMPGPCPYQPPAPQIPASVSTPYSSWRPGTINSSPYCTPHPVFWYSDGSIVFRVENVGYKVHRHFFERHSLYFRDLLAYPAYAVSSPLPHNIYLSDVKKVDFEKLLLIFYPSNLVDSDLFTVEDWTSILTLSDKWNFAQLKTLATRELGYITSSIEKIALAKKYNIDNPQWLLAAYRELCTRRYPLSLVEAEKLGLETVIKIWEVQHELTMTTSAWGRSVDNVVQDKFGLL